MKNNDYRVAKKGKNIEQNYGEINNSKIEER